jgi:hypothetical protein
MRLMLLGAAALAFSSASAQETPQQVDPSGARIANQRLAVTIYNNDLALVEDVRTINPTAGRSRQEFPGVSAQIRPETVSFSSEGTEIVEQNFDYDLLSPDSLMQNAVGQEVRIVRTNPGNGQETTERATVLAVNNGVVLRIGDRIEILRQDSVPTRVIFDRVPPNMRARPTLSVTVDSARAGSRDARISYLTGGLGWRADYVALFDERTNRMDLQGWITLTNQSGVTYEAAQTRLVAGQVGTMNQPMPYGRPGRGGIYPPPPPPPPGGMVRGGVETGQGGQPLADYHIYPLPERTTIAQNQTKQVSFLDVTGAAAQRAYIFRADGFASMERPQQVESVLAFSNAAGAGLGAQLPAGIVRVYQRDQSGAAQFVGENQIQHVPQGSNIAVKTGEAFDITVQSTLNEARETSWPNWRRQMTYVVRNARPQPAVILIRQGGMWPNHRVVEENMRSRVVDTATRDWEVAVPANGEATLRFTVEGRR